MTARRIKKSASRGSVNNIILTALSSGDKYGYEIIKEISNLSSGKIVLKQPSLYSSLNRFEAKGFVSSYWQDSAIGGKRHYYCLTPSGKEYYSKYVQKDDNDNVSDENDFLNEDEEFIEEDNDDNINSSEEGYDYDIDSDESPSEDSVISNNSLNKYGMIDIEEKVNKLLNTKQDLIKTNAIKTPSNNIIEENSNDNQINNDTEQENYEIEQPIENEDAKLDYVNNSDIFTTPQLYDNNQKSINSDLNNFANNFSKENNLISDNQIETINDETNNNYIQSNNTEINTQSNVESNAIEVLEKVDEQRNIIDNANNSEEIKYSFHNPQHTPLSYIEEQKRKESMAILYGNNHEQKTYKPFYNNNAHNIFFTNSEIKKTISNENTNEINETFNNEESFTEKNNLSSIQNYINKTDNSKNQANINTNETDENIKNPNMFSEFVVDENGIMKIKTGESNSNKKQSSIIDNVGYRSANVGNTGINARYFQKQPINHQKTESFESHEPIGISPEEMAKRSVDFKEKFENISKVKIEKRKNNVDYKDILGDLYAHNPNKQVSDSANTPIVRNNNIDDINENNIDNLPELVEEDVVKLNENVYKSANIPVKLKPESANNSDIDLSFVKINKAKFVFGVFLTFIMLLEITGLLVIYKKLLPLTESDKTLFIIAYSISIIVGLCFIIPYLFNQNKRKQITSKLSYEVMFGLILFIIIVILDYAINIFLGFEINNIEFYYLKLIIPALLGVNFIIAPLILRFICKRKSMY